MPSMTEILDEIQSKKSSKKYSFLALFNACISMILVSYLILSIPRTIKVSEGFQVPPMWLIITTSLCCITGIVWSTLSFVRKEPSSWPKWIGGVFNVAAGVNLARTGAQRSANRES